VLSAVHSRRRQFMKLLATLAATVILLAPATQAQESPDTQIEFIRNLRAKGYADLAMLKLEELQKNPPKDLESKLPLEVARTRLALGRDKGPEEKLNLAAVAEKELKAFVTTFAGKPEALQGRLEIARLASYQGQAWLNKALRQEDAKLLDEDALRAEQFFIRAGAELTAAAADLPGQDKLNAQFDRGIAMVEQARCNFALGSKGNKKGAGLIRDARKVFEPIYDSKTPMSALAAAWLIKCCYEGDAPADAPKYYQYVMNQTGAAAQTRQALGPPVRHASHLRRPGRQARLPQEARSRAERGPGLAEGLPRPPQEPRGLRRPFRAGRGALQGSPRAQGIQGRQGQGV